MHERVWGADGLLDQLGRRLDGCHVGEIEGYPDQPRVVGTRTGRLPQSLHARINRSHGRDNTPPLLVQVRR